MKALTSGRPWQAETTGHVASPDLQLIRDPLRNSLVESFAGWRLPLRIPSVDGARMRTWPPFTSHLPRQCEFTPPLSFPLFSLHRFFRLSHRCKGFKACPSGIFGSGAFERSFRAHALFLFAFSIFRVKKYSKSGALSARQSLSFPFRPNLGKCSNRNSPTVAMTYFKSDFNASLTFVLETEHNPFPIVLILRSILIELLV